MKKATHPQVIEFCELKGIDHTNDEKYFKAKEELEILMNYEEYKDLSVEEIVKKEFS